MIKECHLKGIVVYPEYPECHSTVYKCIHCKQITCQYHVVYVPKEHNWICEQCLAYYHSTKTFSDGELWAKSFKHIKGFLEDLEDKYLTKTKAYKQ